MCNLFLIRWLHCLRKWKDYKFSRRYAPPPPLLLHLLLLLLLRLISFPLPLITSLSSHSPLISSLAFHLLAPHDPHLCSSPPGLQEEVKAIVKQRTDYEYLLRRRQLSPADFYKYLKFELNLEELRSLRSHALTYSHRKALDRATKKGDNEQESAAEGATKEAQQSLRRLQTSFHKHICYIFERACRRFPNSMELWNDYLQFLKEKKSYNVLNTVYAKVLSLYPTQEDLWLQASMNELSVNANAHAARVLLQRALRFNAQSMKLWLRYFELELWYSLRNHERRVVLGLAEEGEGLENDTEDPTLGIPWVVYQHAVSAVIEKKSDSSSSNEENESEENEHQQFCLSFLRSCEGLSSSLHQRIYFDIENRYAHTPQYWINLFQQYVQSTSFEEEEGSRMSMILFDPEVDKILGKKRSLEEAEDGEGMKDERKGNHIDSITKYLESCFQILCNYETFQKKRKQKKQSQEHSHNVATLYGSLVTDAFRRVMNQMAIFSYEFTFVEGEPSSTASKSSKKNKRVTGKDAEGSTDSQWNQNRVESIQKLAEIFEKFRVMLLTVHDFSGRADEDTKRSFSHQDEALLLISQHELYRCLSFLKQQPIQQCSALFSIEKLMSISDLLRWISITTASVTSLSPHYRDIAVGVWKILEILWKSSFASFSNLDFAHHQFNSTLSPSTAFSTSPPATTVIEDLKSVVHCIQTNLPLILVAQETIFKKDSHVIPLENLLTEFFQFLTNPSPLLAHLRPNRSLGGGGVGFERSPNDDSDDEEETDEEDETMEFLPTPEEILKQLISAPTCLPSQRAQWCLYLVHLSSSSSSSLPSSYESCVDWIENILQQLPQSLSGGDLTTYYQPVIEQQLHLLRASSSSSLPSSQFQTVDRLLQSALQRCPSSVTCFEEMLAEVERMKGNHKSANHLLWRNRKGLGS